MRNWTGAFGALNGLIAVAVGAIGAHRLDGHAAEIVAKASEYELIHALALLILADKAGGFFLCARTLFACGLIFFCGSLYADGFAGWAPHTAPLGGVCFMAGWLATSIGYAARHEA